MRNVLCWNRYDKLSFVWTFITEAYSFFFCLFCCRILNAKNKKTHESSLFLFAWIKRKEVDNFCFDHNKPSCMNLSLTIGWLQLQPGCSLKMSVYYQWFAFWRCKMPPWWEQWLHNLSSSPPTLYFFPSMSLAAEDGYKAQSSMHTVLSWEYSNNTAPGLSAVFAVMNSTTLTGNDV